MTHMIIYGTVIRIGDAITTTQIIAPELRDAGDPSILAAGCLAAVDPSLAERVTEEHLLVAGRDFGAGEDPVSAALALLALGIPAVVCTSAAPAFAAEAGALGLPVLETPGADTLADGQLLRIDLATGRMTVRDTGAELQALALPAATIAAVRQSLLLSRMRRVVEEEGFDG
jgi:3-isopropylmalate dehydratase small subunit